RLYSLSLFRGLIAPVLGTLAAEQAESLRPGEPDLEDRLSCPAVAEAGKLRPVDALLLAELLDQEMDVVGLVQTGCGIGAGEVRDAERQMRIRPVEVAAEVQDADRMHGGDRRQDDDQPSVDRSGRELLRGPFGCLDMLVAQHARAGGLAMPQVGA